MKITHSHRFAAPVDDVYAMFTNEDFLRKRARASGSADADVLLDHGDDGTVTVIIRRAVPSASIPAEFRSFVGTSLSVRYTEVWTPSPEGEDVEGTFAMDIPGTPGHARGAVVLRPDGDHTSFAMAGDVSAPLPLVGPVVEKAVASAIEQALPSELAVADEWLASRQA